MLLSEFVNILYKYSGDSQKKADFFVFLFDTLINASSESDNPLYDLQPDTLERYFSGKIKVAKAKAHKARVTADIHNFASHINTLGDSNQIAIEDELKAAIPNFNKDDNLGYACADLFLQILDEIYDETSVSYKTENPSASKAADAVKKQTTNTVAFKQLYKSSCLSVPEQLQLKDSNAVISINNNPELFSPNSSSNTVYKYQTDYQFKSAIAPDRSRQVKVSTNINGILFSGFTSTDNWESKSVMNNIIFAGNRNCTAWFYIVSANSKNSIVQFLMIGDAYE